MRSFALASGSSGNCFFIENESGIKVLVDLGLSFGKTKEILESRNIDINSINAIFITHEHSDHIKGFDIFLKKLDCDFYISKGTYEGLNDNYDEFLDKIKFVKNHSLIDLSGVRVFVVEKSHDSKEAVSFVFDDGKKKIGIFTDLGEVSNEIKHILRTLDVVYFEANYCEDYINKNCRHMSPNYLNRLMSNKGHLSLKQSIDCLKEVAKNGQRIVLCHVSENTNFYENAYLQIRDALNSIELFPEIFVSFQGEACEWIE
ncbi:MAG: MBL fold metallo-hydrolase [Nanoarchaeota archaeon]|nr:MBL fold metallo-hydrolase [Nanoarchaeota archaeon]